ncbi:hypothetical protein BDN72DRAFT_906807 [Pluteus cervinus]|uniref:Uncharacterized protein n=1 Tax=Pluteus cervinus TaxID=181527 RepID=A0ACD2ZZ60_9AGAR|nr:hypothetical protein BDN72DRAFT_906807 [Pluteus cervinus]
MFPPDPFAPVQAADAKSSPVIIQLPHGIEGLIQEAVRIQDDGYESETEQVECVGSDAEDEHEEIATGESTAKSASEDESVDEAMESATKSGDADDEPGMEELTTKSVDAHEERATQLLQETSIQSKSEYLPNKTLPRKEKQRRRRNLKNDGKRRIKRIATAKGKVIFHYRFKRPPKGMSKALSTVEVDINAATTLCVSGGGSWLGKRITVKRTTPWTLPELRARGFRYIDWDGM